MTEQTAKPQGSGWTVTGQIETTQIGPTGNLQKGVQVTFTTGAGASGSVFVPHERFNASTVRDAIRQRAAILDTVANLSE